jgi:hypothetical protein
MPARKTEVVEEKVSKKCNNHPGRNATLVTTSNGTHSEVALCEECTPEAWKEGRHLNVV